MKGHLLSCEVSHLLSWEVSHLTKGHLLSCEVSHLLSWEVSHLTKGHLFSCEVSHLLSWEVILLLFVDLVFVGPIQNWYLVSALPAIQGPYSDISQLPVNHGLGQVKNKQKKKIKKPMAQIEVKKLEPEMKTRKSKKRKAIQHRLFHRKYYSDLESVLHRGQDAVGAFLSPRHCHISSSTIQTRCPTTLHQM